MKKKMNKFTRDIVNSIMKTNDSGFGIVHKIGCYDEILEYEKAMDVESEKIYTEKDLQDKRDIFKFELCLDIIEVIRNENPLLQKRILDFIENYTPRR